jgi:hypothetical protein
MMKLGWSQEKLNEFLAKVNKDTKNPNIHAYSPMQVFLFLDCPLLSRRLMLILMNRTVVYGRKPGGS